MLRSKQDIRKLFFPRPRQPHARRENECETVKREVQKKISRVKKNGGIKESRGTRGLGVNE